MLRMVAAHPGRFQPGDPSGWYGKAILSQGERIAFVKARRHIGPVGP